MIIKKTLLSIFLILSILLLTGCGNNNTNIDDLKSKAIEEINYLDNKFLSLANKLNNINTQNYKVETTKITSDSSENAGNEGQTASQGSNQQGSGSGGSSSQGGSGSSSSSQGSDSGGQQKEITVTEMKITSVLSNADKEIDWNTIKGEIELLYGVWNTIILDLYKLNVPAEKISEFSDALNVLTINAKSEDKQKTLTSISTLYSYIPTFLEYYSDDKELLIIKNTKKYLLNAYSLVDTENWDNITDEVNNAVQSYVPVLNNVEFTKNKEHGVNRSYIILNELKSCLKQKNKDIFYINYKNLINELGLLL